MKFTAVGDMLIQKRIQPSYKGYTELAPFIEQGDARFFNLETTLNRIGEACGAAQSGGTYLRADPDVLDDIKKLGFNMATANNNHALDFSYDGLRGTLDTLDKSGLTHAGLGRNLAEAAAPRYLETPNGRVALIAVNTSFNPAMQAGEQTPLLPGRPGINGLRIESYVQLPVEDLAYIRRIAAATGINAAKDISRREGYYPMLGDDEAALGELMFKRGDEPRFVMEINKRDMARLDKSICEAKLQADYIIISVHSHQISGTAKENPADFLRDLAHHCIDVGAHAIIGHGPHLLRPIEVYKDCPIFYSLGDFVLQLYDVEVAPQEFFETQGLCAATDTVHELLKKRSKDFTVGLMTDKRMYRAVIPCWETDGTKLKKLTLMPVECSMDGVRGNMGLPHRTDNPEIAEYLAAMCAPYGTTVHREEDGMLTCTW
ncbi:MAG: CapA family protein [Clostridia bacterium]|nr:CapA family protein [Clostridia bacterium]